MTDPYTNILERIDKKMDNTDDLLKDLGKNMSQLAISMAQMGEAHKTIQQQLLAQKETEEAQNYRMSGIESDMHDIEKKLIPLEPLPQSIEKNWSLTRSLDNTSKANEVRLDRYEKVLDATIGRVEALEYSQQSDETKWKVTTGVGSWFANKVLVPLLTTLFTLGATVLGFYTLGG